MTIITDPVKIDLYSYFVLRHRLKIEIKMGTKYNLPKSTMHACRRLGFDGRNRKQALEWVNQLIERKKNELAKV